MRCDKCMFFELTAECKKDTELWAEDDKEGICRRFPPQIDTAYLLETQKEIDYDGSGSESSSRFWRQPLTTASDWCGEFKASL